MQSSIFKFTCSERENKCKEKNKEKTNKKQKNGRRTAMGKLARLHGGVSEKPPWFYEPLEIIPV